MDTFDEELIKEINEFRTNPKIIKNNFEKRFKTLNIKIQNETVLKEIKAFIKNIEGYQCYPKLENNNVLKEIAKIELLKLKKEKFNSIYINNNEIKKLIPKYFSDYEVLAIKMNKMHNIVIDILLEKPDIFKTRKNILCNSIFTYIGIAKELDINYKKDNIYILIFAAKIIPELKIIKKERLYNLKRQKFHNILKKQNLGR